MTATFNDSPETAKLEKTAEIQDNAIWRELHECGFFPSEQKAQKSFCMTDCRYRMPLQHYYGLNTAKVTVLYTKRTILLSRAHIGSEQLGVGCIEMEELLSLASSLQSE
ncbi:hypothetical protein RB195_018988 [Necator americanus]